MLKDNGRIISPQEIEAFERDGVICLKKIVNDNWIERLRAAVDRNLLNTVGASGCQLRKEADVVHDHSLWLKDNDFRALAFDSPLPIVASQLLKSQTLNFLADGFFVKKAKAFSHVGWHNDQPYWPVQGWKCCKIWLTLDYVTQENGRLEYIKGSHLWNKELRENSNPSWFKEPKQSEILSWDMEPGDALVHHFLTIHHSVSNISSTRRRAVVANWTGDDITYYNRPNSWPFQPVEEIGIPEFNSLKTLKAGQALNSKIFPQIEFN